MKEIFNMNEMTILYALLSAILLLCVVIVYIQSVKSKKAGEYQAEIKNYLQKQQNDLESIKSKDNGIIVANIVKEEISKDLENSNLIEVQQLKDIQSFKMQDHSGKDLCSIDFNIPQDYLIKDNSFAENKHVKWLLENLFSEGLRKSDVVINAVKQRGMFLAEFSPETLSALKKGYLKLMGGVRLVAVGAKEGNGLEIAGKIIKNGKTAAIAKNAGPAGGVAAVANPVTIALAIWQIMATITLQHYIAVMDDKMSSILQGIWDIKYKINNDRLGKIKSAMCYLENVQDRVKKGFINQDNLQTYLLQMEIIERDCKEVICACNYDITSYIPNTLAKVNPDQDMNANADNIIKTIDEYNYLQSSIYFAEYVLVELEQVRSILGVEYDQIKDDFDSIRALIENQSQFTNDNKTALFDGINKLKAGFFTSNATAVKLQENVKKYFVQYSNKWDDKAIKLKQEVKKRLEMVDELENIMMNPITLAIKLDKNMDIERIGLYNP